MKFLGPVEVSENNLAGRRGKMIELKGQAAPTRDPEETPFSRPKADRRRSSLAIH